MSELFQNEKWKSVIKDSRFSPPHYRKYISNVKRRIEDIEKGVQDLSKLKEISELSYDDWLTKMNGYK